MVIDGADPLQIKWFKNTPYADNHQARLLLSDGYASQLIRQLKRSVFYLTSDIAERLHLPRPLCCRAGRKQDAGPGNKIPPERVEILMKNSKPLYLCVLITLLCISCRGRKIRRSFNSATDVHWDEIEFRIEGICICPRPPPVFYEKGVIISYWEPFLLEDTVSVANYSAYQGEIMGSSLIDELGGKNKSSDSVDIANESTFAQAHAYLLPLMYGRCNRNDYGMWWSEYDSMWQNDELSAIIHPEASLYANKVMQMACMADAAAVNLGYTLDFMPWCIGSGGSAYPMTGHVDNDNIVQANNTVASTADLQTEQNHDDL